MIYTQLPIENTDLSSVDPSRDAVVDQLKILLNIPDMHTIYVARKKDIRNDKWNLDTFKKDVVEDLRDSQIVIHTSFKDADNGVIRNPIDVNYNKPIIYDPVTRVKVTPAYVRCTVNLSISILTKSERDLYRILSRIRDSYRSTTDLQLHTIRHTMNIGQPILDLLYEIYLTKLDVLNIDEEFVTYIRNISDSRVTITTGQDGQITSDSLTAIETRNGVQGYFTSAYDIDSIDSNVGEYSKLDLDYTFTYDRPIEFSLEYNQMVYNMLLPDEYIMFGTRNNRTPSALAYDQYLQEWFSTFNQTNQILSMMRENDNYIRIPYYDVHRNMSIPKHSAILFSKLVSLDDDMRCLGNLNDLDDMTIKPEILEFLKAGEYEFITKQLQSLFRVQLAVNDEITSIPLIVDADLNVCAKVDLDISKSYRLVFSYVIDIIHLSQDARNRVLENNWLIDNTVAILSYVTNNGEPNPGTVDSSILLNNNNSLVGMVAKYTENMYMSRYFVSSIITRLMEMKGGL